MSGWGVLFRRKKSINLCHNLGQGTDWWTFWIQIDGLFEQILKWNMELMDFLEKCLKSPSMTHEIDGLFGKVFKKPALQWHMKLMDFLEKIIKSPS